MKVFPNLYDMLYINQKILCIVAGNCKSFDILYMLSQQSNVFAYLFEYLLGLFHFKILTKISCVSS